jgi:hypothetical protein
MFPPGFLGTRADILIDIVTLSFAVIVPVLVWSWLLVTHHRKYTAHRNIQVTLAVLLAIVVALFEFDLAVSGGIFEVTKGGSYEGTAVLNFWIWSHMAFALLASLSWVLLIIVSLICFPNPPKPTTFSRIHRFFGRFGMIVMILAATSAVPLYYYGFAA